MNIHKRAQRLRRRGTQWEQVCRIAFRRQGINHLFQYVYYPYIVDFLLYDRNVILEVDGQHHRHKVVADTRRTEMLEATTGCKVVRWWNIDVTAHLPRLIAELREAHPVVNGAPPDITYGHMLG